MPNRKKVKEQPGADPQRSSKWVSPPPSAVAPRIARQIGENVEHEAVDYGDIDNRRTAHAHIHDEAHAAEQRYLENRPGPHS
jgi:hypothetical protein